MKMLAKISAVILGLAGVVMVAAAFLGEFALGLLFGDKILPHVSMLMPILGVNFIRAYFGFFCMLAIVQRRFRWLLSGCFTGFLLSVFLTKPAIRFWDANGTSYSIIFATAVACVILLWGILRDAAAMHPQKGAENL